MRPDLRFFLPLFLLAAGSLRADDWPQWRGPQRNGISRETGLLKEWPQEGPKKLWQVSDIGYGFSTPAVAGNRLFALSNEGMENEFVLALSTEDGRRLWSTRLGKVGKPDQQPAYPAARSTPTVEGNRLYALSSDGDLACLETATGKLLWKRHLPTDFGGQSGTWAYAESPLIDGDALICTPGGKEATVLALNKRTGATLWKAALPEADQAGYSSVVIARIGGVKQYVQFIQKGVVGLDPASGKLLWRYTKTAEGSPGNIQTPVVAEDRVYSGASLTGGGLARLQATSAGFTVEPVYFAKRLPNGIGGVVKLGDYLYGTSGPSLMCIEFATGTVKWQERGIGAASLCFADGRLYLHGENGEMALVEPSPDSYREKGRFTPPSPPDRARTQAWTYPVVANGRLYVRDLGTLCCYDIQAR